jgi:hypothetical protein
MRERCETLPGAPLLIEHLLKAEELISAALSSISARILDWYNKTDVDLGINKLAYPLIRERVLAVCNT